MILKKSLLSPPWKKTKAKSISSKDIGSCLHLSNKIFASVIFSLSSNLLCIKICVPFCSFNNSVKAPLVKYLVKFIKFLIIKLLTTQFFSFPESKSVQALK